MQPNQRAPRLRILAWLEILSQDLRYAFRGLRRTPGFTAAAVITLGLGIGANAAMFGIIDRLMFRPYPLMRDPASVNRVYLMGKYRGAAVATTRMPYTRYLDIQKMTSSFSEFAAYSQNVLVVGVGEAAREEPVVAASAGFFGFFDIRPVLGRFFTAAEDGIPEGANVAVLSYPFWQANFGGRNVIGETVDLGYVKCTIIGVTPRGFSGVTDGRTPALFFPMTTFGSQMGDNKVRTFFRDYTWDWTEVLVRRKPGVTASTASADLTDMYIRSRAVARVIHPEFAQIERADPHAVAGSLRGAAGPDPSLEARTLLWVTGVAVIVLLIACANVANLCLARAFRRRREIALRLALGVSSGRLMAQSLTESIVLSLLGCALGVAIAQWGGAALARLFLPSESSFSVASDWRTLVVAIGAALVAGLATGFAPVLLAERDDLAKTLKSGVREGTYIRSKTRSSLLVFQGALSVMLLVGAGLFVRSLDRVRGMRLGYDVSSVLAVQWNRRGMQMSDSERMDVRNHVLRAAQAIPGVEHAAWVSSVPFEGTGTNTFVVPGVDSVSTLGRFDAQTATADYFATVQTHILRGRSFTSADRAGAPGVVVVSEGMARTVWPGQEALGKCMQFARPGVSAETAPCAAVIGIAEDVVHSPVADEPFRYYVPVEQFQDFGSTELLLRMRDNSTAAAEGVRRILRREMTGLSFITARPLSELINAQQRSWQIGATMFVAFGILALIVAAVGLYGVIAYNVAQRMHELGVRVALGAQPANILGLIIGSGMRFAIAGVALGTLLALSASRWLQPLLFRQSAHDPAVYALVGGALLFVALAASTLPALRAAKADPNVVLRSD